MKKKKPQQQNDGFFIETIDLTPSNNITSTPSQNGYNQTIPDYDSGMRERINEKRFVKKVGQKLKSNVVKIIAILLCAYMVFLIIGALRTNYYIDAQTGTRQPVFVTFEDVAKKNDYNNLKKEMAELREILVDVRIIEIKYNNKELDAMEAANRYNKQLSRIDVIIPKLQALNVKDSQEPIKESLLGCYKTYLAGYLQEMYKGLSNSDNNAISSALQYRELMLQSYFTGEEALEKLAEKLKLQDGFFDWELDKAAKEKDPTAVLK